MLKRFVFKYQCLGHLTTDTQKNKLYTLYPIDYLDSAVKGQLIFCVHHT